MNVAIIFAGGSGVRMGKGVPKQFLEINGKPILIHTLELFQEHHMIDKIYIAMLEAYIPYVWDMTKRYHITKVADIVPGGSSAQESIYRALSRAQRDVDDNSVVLIHDGVRPFVSYDVISSNIECVKKYGSAITSNLCYETVLISKDEGETVDEVPNRKDCYLAQAPQSFFLKDILAAHNEIRKENPEYKNIVDSCTLMERFGKIPRLLIGNRGNIKITTPVDVYMFRALLTYKENEQTFGLGITDKIQSKMGYYNKLDEKEEGL